MRSGRGQSIGDEPFNQAHWRILQALADRHGRSMAEPAERVLMNGPALTKNIDKPVSLGAVQRAADPGHNRRVLDHISDLGLETIARLQQRVDPHHATIEEALGPRKTHQLKRLLGSFIAESKPNQG